MPGTGCGLTNLRHETDEEPGILTDGTGDQVFNVLKNDVKTYPQAVRAVVETVGQILTYKGSMLLDGPYGASNKGCTVAYKNYPYLVERPDPWDAVESKRRRDLGLSVKVGNRTGLSQYGARHAASIGIGYREILNFYYPNTDITDTTHWFQDATQPQVMKLSFGKHLFVYFG